MKLGLIGLGVFHTQYHAPAILKCTDEDPSLDVVLCDLSEERLSSWRQRFRDYPGYLGIDALLASERLDAAYITVQPAACCAVVGRCLEAGIPSFTEKPPGMTAVETRQLAAAAGKLPHAVGFNRRFSPILRKLRDIAVDVGRQASPLRFRCEFRRVARYDADFATTLIHGVDALRFLGGDFASLSIHIRRMDGGGKPFRDISFHGVMTSGALVEMTVLPACGQAVERYFIDWEGISARASLAMPGLADAGEVEIWQGGRMTERHTEDGLGLSGTPDFVRFGFYGQARQFLDGLRGTVNGCGTSLQESIQSVEIADFLRLCPAPAEGVKWTNTNSG